MSVRAKKYLGQHFLKDENIAKKIADTLSLEGYQNILEIGPGMGVLTKYLLKKDAKTYVIEYDSESVAYLKAHFLDLSGRIIEQDFLQYDPRDIFKSEPFAIIGNFPYNISTQIMFKTLELRDHIPEFSGMFQKKWHSVSVLPKGIKCMVYFQYWPRLSTKPNIYLRYHHRYLIHLPG